MDTKLRRAKLARLMELEGFESIEDLAQAVLSDAVSPAICIQRARQTLKPPGATSWWLFHTHP